jgi:hypothetical protein
LVFFVVVVARELLLDFPPRGEKLRFSVQLVCHAGEMGRRSAQRATAPGEERMTITMVKRVMPDGKPCPKCQDVVRLLEDRGYSTRIDRTVEASPREPNGEGMRLVKTFKMKRAPFFVVQQDDGGEVVYDSALRLIKEVFEKEQQA